MISIAIIITIILLLCDSYIAFCVLSDAGWYWKLAVYVPTAIYSDFIFTILIRNILNQKIMNIVFRFTLLLLFGTLIFVFISGIGFILSMFSHDLVRLFNWIALGFCGVWVCIVGNGTLIGWKKITVKRVEIKMDRLPREFDGYKIAHLSDLHLGTYITAPYAVRKIVKKVKALHPDLIVFTGDIVNNSAAEVEPFVEDLSQLNAPDGVISVVGNHDYCLYRKYTPPDSPEKQFRKIIELEEKAGWKVLRNQSVNIERGNTRIAVIGVENAGGKSFINRADLKKALSGVPADEFKILLSHDPSHWRRKVLPDSDIDLTLSGHTHAMQFKIAGFSPSRWTYREWGGVYSQGDRKLIVSTGTGGNIAFRFGVNPQILDIVLRCDSK